MSSIKKLAGQTLWYGLPTIASRFLGYLMNMALPFFISIPGNTADLVQVYTIIPFLNVVFSYGMETAYFRFSQTLDSKKLYNTLSVSLLASTILFGSLLLLLKDNLVAVAGLENHPEFVNWMIWIIVVDNLSTLPFAKLRQENRPRKYAFARISGILVNLLIVLLFIGVIPGYLQKHPDSLLQLVFDEKLGLGYYLAGNLCGSLFTLLLLFGELKQLRWQFDTQIWKEAIKYSSPLIIVGLGGMTNDVLSRLMYRHVVNLPASEANHELGIFANIFRLALLITIMIQAFRMAAEPYFFNKSKDEDARRTYARVMKFFVIACCFMFLGVALFLDVFKWIFTHFTNPAWAEGLEVVPLLALGNIFLGIYYNLSIWYKLTNKNMMGAYITLLGAVVTIALNLLLIPIWHYTGAAIASFTCYLIMMLVSYKQGKKHYPVPYATKKLTAYIILVLSIYLTHRGIGWLISESLGFSLISGACLFIAFAWFVSKVEAKELSKLNIRLFSS